MLDLNGISRICHTFIELVNSIGILYISPKSSKLLENAEITAYILIFN
ncbi:hypothetical protein HOA93_04005 [bacterium]|nr:hypothetical protein [bacterium]